MQLPTSRQEFTAFSLEYTSLGTYLIDEYIRACAGTANPSDGRLRLLHHDFNDWVYSVLLLFPDIVQVQHTIEYLPISGITFPFGCIKVSIANVPINAYVHDAQVDHVYPFFESVSTEAYNRVYAKASELYKERFKT